MDMITSAAPIPSAAQKDTRTPKHRAMAARRVLLGRFPKAFMPFTAPKIPLQLGIFKEIRKHCPRIGGYSARLALQDYCGGKTYLRAMIAGAPRIDLDGNPVDVVTDEQAERAAEQLRLLEVLP